MREDVLFYYNVNASDTIRFGIYDAFRYRSYIYIIVPVEIEEEDVEVLKAMAEFMKNAGDEYVAEVEVNKEGNYISPIDGKDSILLRANRKQKSEFSQGTELAIFHQKGKYFDGEVGGFSRIGQWKDLWIHRVDFLESHWGKILNEQPVERFDRWFMESYPYYMGIAENAIQYLVDTELDEEPKMFDAGTFCYERFNRNSWGEDYHVRVPTEWVVDHPSRDLAEWIRFEFFTKQSKKEFQTKVLRFLNDYERVTPLSTFSWRLLYARLLYPVHYFTTIENYYMSQDREDKYLFEERLQSLIEESDQYEAFLREFFREIRLPTSKLKIPKVDWL